MIYRKNDNVKKTRVLLDKLKDSSNKFEVAELKEILERNYSILSNGIDDFQNYNLALSVICHVADLLPKDNLIKQLLHDNIVKSRVFLYDEMISSKYQSYLNDISVTHFDIIGEEFYRTDLSETILTRDQKRLFDDFQNKRRLIVSAPTSFGKSRIVQEIIVHNDYKNILIVLPTIALLNETFVRFKTNKQIADRYNLFNTIGKRETSFPEEDNIFILTPEKTDLLLDEHEYIKFDFFTMDEIYKIQGSDDRCKIFTNCLYRLSKINNIHFYLIGPYFSGFSEKFQNKTDSQFKIFQSEIVQKDDFDISIVNQNDFYSINGKKIKKLKSSQSNLRNVLNAVEGQSLVYRGQTKYYAELTAKYLIQYKKRETTSELVDYISDNISKDWTLVECLKSGIAFHHGALPKYIQTEIMDSFNQGELDTIVCTSTIVEGVNTTAKNVIIYDNYKGGSELTGFDVKNIKGRAGRFLSHFIGNVYSLVPLSLEENKGIIEFSFYDREILDAEDVIQIDKKELSDKNLEIRENVESILKRNKIPLWLIKSNKFIGIHKQIALINHLRNDIFILDDIYFDGIYPNKEQLEKIIFLCHEYLFTNRDAKDKNYTINQLASLTKYYVYKKPSLKELIKAHEFKSDKIDTVVRNTFNLISHYFEFALPKYFTAFENLFNFVCHEKGKRDIQIKLKYLITLLEFGHDNPHEIALKESGLPNEIIKKVGNNFSDCNSLEEIRDKYKMNPYLISSLTEFEKKLFNRYV
jgi:ERCC4-related helicase